MFLTAQWRLQYTGSSGLVRVFDYDLLYIGESELACFVYLSHCSKLLIRARFFGPCHCSYIFVPRLASRVHVAGDLNKTISLVASVLSTSFARALLGLIH